MTFVEITLVSGDTILVGPEAVERLAEDGVAGNTKVYLVDGTILRSADTLEDVQQAFEDGFGTGGGLVMVSDDDTTPDYLAEKVTAGDGIATSVLNPGADEQLEISLAVTLLPKAYLTAAGQTEVVTLGSEVLVGSFLFAGNQTWPSFSFTVMGTIHSANADVDVLLYDVGPPGTPEAGTLRSTLNLTALEELAHATVVLETSDAPGTNADLVLDEVRMYEVRVLVNNADPGDTFDVAWAGLECAQT